MTIKVGCFALVDPFSLLDHQLERVAGLGFKYADVTDNHPGGILGREFGFTATASLDDNPLDTGNSWLGGADPVEMAKVFKDKIFHIHWKDLSADWEPKRGTMYGCGFGPIALGEGVVDIKGVFEVLKDSPHVEYSTLEVGGDANVLKSYAYLKALGAE